MSFTVQVSVKTMQGKDRMHYLISTESNLPQMSEDQNFTPLFVGSSTEMHLVCYWYLKLSPNLLCHQNRTQALIKNTCKILHQKCRTEDQHCLEIF